MSWAIETLRERHASTRYWLSKAAAKDQDLEQALAQAIDVISDPSADWTDVWGKVIEAIEKILAIKFAVPMQPNVLESHVEIGHSVLPYVLPPGVLEAGRRRRLGWA
jgi:hypothetical protein